MEIYTRIINLDFAQKGNPKKIFAKQGDRLSRQLLILPMLNGVSFQIADTAKVRFACQKADKTQVLTDEGIDTESTNGDGILVLIPESVMAAAGFALCEIVIEFENGAVISSENFIIDVVENPLDGSIESHDDYQAFKKELAKLRGGVTWAIHDNFGEDTVMAIEIDEANRIGDYTMQVGDLVIDNEGKIGQIESLDKERYNAIVRYITTIEAGLPNYSEEDAFNVLTVSPNGNLFWGNTRVDGLIEKIDEEIMPTIEKNTADIESQKVSIVNHDKRITNLEKGLPFDRFVTDESIAYVKTVPVDTLPYAAVSKIGGMTVKDGDALKSAKVTEIEIVGANLFNPNQGFGEIRGGSVRVENSVFIVTPETNDPYFFVSDKWLGLKKGSYYLYVETNPTANVDLWIDASNLKVRNSGFFEITDNSNMHIELEDATIGTIYEVKIAVYKQENNAYAPYVKRTLELPEAAQVENGTDSNCYDYIEWTEDGARLKHIKVGVIDMGALKWSKTSSTVGNTYNAEFKAMKLPTPTVLAERATGILCVKYENRAGSTTDMQDKTMLRHETGYVYIRDTDYADAASFKAAMQGVMLYYELAEPIVTDISDVLTADNLIEVEGGGTLTFINEHGLAVPSTITYQVKGV